MRSKGFVLSILGALFLAPLGDATGSYLLTLPAEDHKAKAWEHLDILTAWVPLSDPIQTIEHAPFTPGSLDLVVVDRNRHSTFPLEGPYVVRIQFSDFKEAERARVQLLKGEKLLTILMTPSRRFLWPLNGRWHRWSSDFVRGEPVPYRHFSLFPSVHLVSFQLWTLDANDSRPAEIRGPAFNDIRPPSRRLKVVDVADRDHPKDISTAIWIPPETCDIIVSSRGGPVD